MRRWGRGFNERGYERDAGRGDPRTLQTIALAHRGGASDAIGRAGGQRTADATLLSGSAVVGRGRRAGAKRGGEAHQGSAFSKGEDPGRLRFAERSAPAGDADSSVVGRRLHRPNGTGFASR